MMIRRNVLHEEIERRGVKWTLLVAALALTIGFTAKTLEDREQMAQDPVAAEILATSVSAWTR
jgi:hypothetical protein